MILAVDIGNTHTVFGCINEKNQVVNVFKITTDRGETEYGYGIKLRQLFELQNIDRSAFCGAIISSVVPPVTQTIKNAVQLITGETPLIVGAGIKTGLHLMVDDPGTVAGDLVATAIGAKEEYPLPCIIIDMGTATTLTVVDDKGCFIGGAILPGVGISLDALIRDTSLLPRIDIAPPQKAISTNTVECMKSGLVYGAAGGVDGMIRRFSKQLGQMPKSIVTTGGLGGLICPYCEHDIIVDDSLLLRGLGIIWRKNHS